MNWQKRSFWLVGWLLLALACLNETGWSQNITPQQLKYKLSEAGESYSAEDYSKAEDIFVQLSLSFPLDSRFSYFQLMIAKCEYHQKNYSSAEKKFKEIIHQFPQSRFVPTCWLMLGNVAYLQGQMSESAQSFVYAYQLAKSDQLKKLIERSLEPLLKKWLSEKELEKLSQTEKETKLAPEIFIWLGKRNLERGNHAKALEALSYYRDNFPQGEDIREVERLLKETSFSSRQITPVGVLAPLSGDLSLYGKSFSDGIKLALSSYHSPKVKIELLVKDTEGEPHKAGLLCEELMREDKVISVIGPLSSESAGEAGTVAERWGIPLITPAVKERNETTSVNSVFWLSSSPTRKAKSMAEFLIRNQKFTDFVILLPEEGQSRIEALDFKETVEKLGGKLVTVEHYPFGTDDFSTYIRKIKSVLLGMEPSTLQDESGSFFDQMPARVDGFFISADESQMYTILSSLSNFKIYTTIIGMEMWKDPHLLSLAQSLKQEMIFTSEEYSDDKKPKREDFLNLYHAKYEKEPDQFFKLGYDSMKLLLSILENSTSPEEINDALLKTSDFKGASGEISFDENGENSYVPIYKLENGQLRRLW